MIAFLVVILIVAACFIYDDYVWEKKQIDYLRAVAERTKRSCGH